MSPYPLTNFEYYRNETKFNCIYSRNNLSETRHETYIRNPDTYESKKTHWIALYVNAENVTYFDSFGVENISDMIFIEYKHTIQ